MSAPVFHTSGEAHDAGVDLAAEAVHLRRLIEGQPSCLMRIDLGGQLLAVNGAALGLLGATELGQALNRNLREQIVPDHRSRWRDFAARIGGGQPASMECDFTNFGGAERSVLLQGVPLLDHPDAVPSVIVSARDTSATRRLEQVLEKEVEIELDAAIDEQQRADELKEQLDAAMLEQTRLEMLVAEHESREAAAVAQLQQSLAEEHQLALMQAERDARQRFEAAAKELEEVQGDRDRTRAEVEQARAELEEARNAVAQAQTALAQTQSELSDVRAQLDRARTERERVEAAAEEARSRAEADLASAAQIREHLEGELARSREERSRLEGAQAEAVRQRDELKAESQRSVEALKAQHETESSRLREQLKAEHEADSERLRETLKAQQEIEALRLREALKSAHDAETQRLREELRGAHEAEAQRFRDDLKAAQEAEAGRLREALKTAHEAETLRLREALKSAQEVEHLRLREELKGEHHAELARLRQELESGRGAEAAQGVEQLKREHDVEIARLKEELRGERQSARSAAEKVSSVEVLQGTLDAARLECDRLRSVVGQQESERERLMQLQTAALDNVRALLAEERDLALLGKEKDTRRRIDEAEAGLATALEERQRLRSVLQESENERARLLAEQASQRIEAEHALAEVSLARDRVSKAFTDQQVELKAVMGNTLVLEAITGAGRIAREVGRDLQDAALAIDRRVQQLLARTPLDSVERTEIEALRSEALAIASLARQILPDAAEQTAATDQN